MCTCIRSSESMSITVSFVQFLFCMCSLGRGTSWTHGTPHSNANMSFLQHAAQQHESCHTFLLLGNTFIYMLYCFMPSVDHFSVAPPLYWCSWKTNERCVYLESITRYLLLKLLDHQDSTLIGSSLFTAQTPCGWDLLLSILRQTHNELILKILYRQEHFWI